MKFTSRYIDLSDSKRQVPVKNDYMKLKPMNIYRFEFEKTLIEETQFYTFKLGRDYDIVFDFSLDLTDSRNMKIYEKFRDKIPIDHIIKTSIYLMENVSKPPLYPKNFYPYMKIPLIMDGFDSFSDSILRFRIIPNFIINMTIRLIAINPVLVNLQLSGTSFAYLINNNFIKNKRIFRVTEEIVSRDYYRYICMITDMDNNKIDSPLNLNIFPYYTEDEYNRDNEWEKLALISFESFDYIFTNSSFSNITDFSSPNDSVFTLIKNKYNDNSLYNNVYTSQIPFISNCNDLGAYIPLWHLFSYQSPYKNSTNSCKLYSPDTTTPINIFSFSNSIGDECKLKFKCIYNENLMQKSLLFNKPWVFSGVSELPLFYISKSHLSDEQYLSYMGMDFKNTNVTAIDFIAVRPKNKKEKVTSNYVPQTVNFTVYYYQKDASTKEISSAEIVFSEFVSYNTTFDYIANKTYNFHFNLIAWSWNDCMINFMFPIVWYVVVLIIVVFSYISIFGIINIIARRKTKSGLIPSYHPKMSFQQGLASFGGMFLGLIPFIIPFIIYKLTFSKIRFGPVLIDILTDNSLNFGRIGGALIVLSIAGFIWISSMITPQINPFDKQLDLLQNNDVNELHKKSTTLKFVFCLLMVLYSLLLSIEYVISNNIILEISKIFPQIPSILAPIIEITSVQILNHIVNPLFIKIVQSIFEEEFYITPFKILSVFIIKAINFQTKSFTSFVAGYIQQSILSALLGRLIIQSLLPIFMMRISDEKRKNPNVILKAEDFLSDEEKKEKIIFSILSINSLQIVSSLIIVVLISFRYILFDELNINTNKQFYFYYIILTLIITLAEIPLDIIVTNIIECLSGLNMSEKISEFKATYQNKKRTWAIDDLSDYASVNSKKITLMQKLGFSYQYYAILSINCLCVILSMIGIEMISIYNYNPLRDQFMLVMIVAISLYFFCLKLFLKNIFKHTDNIFYLKHMTSKEEEEEIMINRMKQLTKISTRSKVDHMKLIESYKEYLNQNEFKYKARSEDILEKINDKIDKNYERYKNVEDETELVLKLITDSLVDRLNKVPLDEPNSDSNIMNAALDYIKCLEYNKILHEKTRLEKLDEENKAKHAVEEKKKNKKNKKESRFYKSKKEKDGNEINNYEKIPSFVKNDSEKYEEAYEDEAEFENVMNLNKFFENINMIPISNTQIEKIIGFVNINNENNSLMESSVRSRQKKLSKMVKEENNILISFDDDI